MTMALSFPPVPLMRCWRLARCMLRALPPMNVSSTSTSPFNLLPKNSSWKRHSDSVQHEPCGLLANLQGAVNFPATNTVLSVGKHPRRGEPLIKADRRFLEERANLDGEFTLGMMDCTLPRLSLGVEGADALRTTVRADDLAIRPAASGQVGNAVIHAVEVEDSLLKALGFFHRAPHKPKYSPKLWASQVNYCPNFDERRRGLPQRRHFVPAAS